MKVSELFEAYTPPVKNKKDELRQIRARIRAAENAIENPETMRATTVDKWHAELKAAKKALASVQESIVEAYEPPVKNTKLGFSAKIKIPIGGSKEWLKTFGATPTHVEQALRVVRQGDAYRAVKALDMKDESTERHNAAGSMMFVGFYKDATTNPPQQGKFKTRRWKFTVQPNGKIDETAPNDFHRAPVASGKPHIVPTDPVVSIVRTMNNALEKLAKNLTNRRAKEKKVMTAVSKAA